MIDRFICHGLMDASGAPFPQAHLDVNAMVDLALAGHHVLEALSTLRRNVGDEVAVFGKGMGPWTLSYHMAHKAGTQNFLLQNGEAQAAESQEDFIHKLRISQKEPERPRDG